jgi:hypothetical protein
LKIDCNSGAPLLPLSMTRHAFTALSGSTNSWSVNSTLAVAMFYSGCATFATDLGRQNKRAPQHDRDSVLRHQTVQPTQRTTSEATMQ